jgi:hypothetical protein
MNRKIIRSCVALWGLGLLGMAFARGLFGLEPGDLAFEISARCFGVGGLGYVVLAIASCLSEREGELAHARDSERD